MSTKLNSADALLNGAIVSNNGLTVQGSSGGGTACRVHSVDPLVTKHYWEDRVDGVGGNFFYRTGWAVSGAPTGSNDVGNNAEGLGVQADGQVVCNYNLDGTTLGTIAVNKTVGMVRCHAIDVPNKLYWMRVNNGNWNNSGTANPATGTGGISWSSRSITAGALYACIQAYDTADKFTAAFAATSWTYAAPSGFVEINASNSTSLDPTWSSGDGVISATKTFYRSGVNGTTSYAAAQANCAGRRTGKWYFEYKPLVTYSANGDTHYIGWAPHSYITKGGGKLGDRAETMTVKAGGQITGCNPSESNNQYLGFGDTYTNNSVVQMATDFDNALFWYKVDGGYWNNNSLANPATGVGGYSFAAWSFLSDLYPTLCIVGYGSATDLDKGVLAFSSADFAYTPPTGFLSVDTAPTAFSRKGTLINPFDCAPANYVTPANWNIIRQTGDTAASTAGIARCYHGLTGSGLYYWEFTNLQALITSTNNVRIGIANASASLAGALGADNNSFGWSPATGASFLNNTSQGTLSAATLTVNTSYGVCYDATNGKIYVRINNGNWNNSGTANPLTNTGGISVTAITGTVYPAIQVSTWTSNTVFSTLQYYGQQMGYLYQGPAGAVEPGYGSTLPTITTLFYTTTGSSLTLPADLDTKNHMVETIGASGSTSGVTTATNAVGGSGAGGYFRKRNISGLTAGGAVNCNIPAAPSTPAAGVAGLAGGDCWFNGTTLAGSSVGSKGGGPGLGAAAGTAGTGGAKASGVGDIGFTGGSGSAGTSATRGGSGGGAAGPYGGGSTASATVGGTSDGQIGPVGATATGAGAPGANGTEWDATHGCGSGGGGKSTANTTAPNSAGGNYGGGSGGARTTSQSSSGCAGKQGMIVLSYIPKPASVGPRTRVQLIAA